MATDLRGTLSALMSHPPNVKHGLNLRAPHESSIPLTKNTPLAPTAILQTQTWNPSKKTIKSLGAGFKDSVGPGGDPETLALLHEERIRIPPPLSPRTADAEPPTPQSKVV